MAREQGSNGHGTQGWLSSLGFFDRTISLGLIKVHTQPEGVCCHGTGLPRVGRWLYLGFAIAHFVLIALQAYWTKPYIYFCPQKVHMLALGGKKIHISSRAVRSFRSCRAVDIFLHLDGALKEDWNRCLNLVECFQYLLLRWPSLAAIVIEKNKASWEKQFIAFTLKIARIFSF